MYVRTDVGSAQLGTIAAGIDVGRAIRMNYNYSQSLGWQADIDRIVRLLGFMDRTPDARSFAEAVARWQSSQLLKADGAIGPTTWSFMRAAMGLTRPEWIEWQPARYHGSRGGNQITAIIYHYTAGPSLKSTAKWFQDPRSKASAHYVLGKDGKIVQMVPLELQAYHAGTSILGARKNVSPFSIGIEIANWGHIRQFGDKWVNVVNGEKKEMRCSHRFCNWRGQRFTDQLVQAGNLYWQPYTEAQYQALIRLTRYLLSQYPAITHITGHEDIARPRGRKQDPGPAFDWNRIRSALAEFKGHIGPLKSV